MQEEHRKAIQRNFGSLVEQTDLDVIVSVLYEKGVFSEAMIEPYKDTTRDVRMRKRDLYRDIERRGPTAFPSLLEALTETGHWDLVRALDPDSNLHPRDKRNKLGQSQSISLQTPDPSFVSLKQYKEVIKKEAETQRNAQAAKIPYPHDFSKPDKTSAEIPHIHVVKSTKFHEEGLDGIPLYRTRSRRRGVLIAFSFIEFSHNVEEHRAGAELDCTNLKYLFDEIGFETIFYNNLSKKGTEDTLRNLKVIKDLEKGSTECVFILVSSHGYERTRTSDTDIRCSDGGLISILSIIEQFNNKNFPSLKDVPKVFIFQSCRGSTGEHIWAPPRPLAAPLASPRLQHDGSARAPRAASPAPAQHYDALAPERLYSDILIAHSTLPGFVSRRDPEKGSWYVQALCEVFAARAHDCHVGQLFTLVDTALHRRFHSQTSSVDRWGFNKLLYLHPGLFED
uniref:Caspase-5 n=1 Tax=Plutella xylostella TaxID=51655 RepID=A0A023J7Q9_PLUXY|nr:caspase-5 [Plutella xylostella]